MRRVELSSGERIKLSTAQRTRLKDWLVNQHLSAINGSYNTRQTWRVCLRMAQGNTDERMWVPFKDAPKMEFPIGAEWKDAIHSQAVDLIFQTNPPLIARARHPEFEKAAEACQELIDYGIRSKLWGFKPAVKEWLLDLTELGPGIAYVPWTRTVRKTDVFKIEARHPRINVVPPEDFIVPVHATKDVQQVRWCTYRHWFSKEDVALRQRLESWDNLADANATSDDVESVRRERLNSAGLYASNFDVRTPYQIGNTFAYYDIDDDGIEETIEIVWNMTSGGIHKVMWMRTDCRPFVFENFQDRAHVAYGRGVMEMAIPYEMGFTAIQNNDIWNMMLANTKIYTMPEAMANEYKEIYPGLIIPNDLGTVEAVDMGQISGAASAKAAQILGMGQQRVGINDMSQPSRLGGRTPGMTAMTVMQQVNRRFAASYDNIQSGAADMILQCVLRYQEQVRAEADLKQKDRYVHQDLQDILGSEKAQALIELFLNRDMEITDAMDISLTSASVSVNKEADRQNMMLLSQAYEKYIGAQLQFAQMKAQAPNPAMAQIAEKASEVVTKFMHKILLTFDQLCDVEQYDISIQDVQPQAQQMAQLMQQMGQVQQQAAAGQMPGGPPAPQGPPPGMPIQ